MTTLTCTNNHVHEIQSWGTVPARCMVAPCSQPFLTPAQVGARTRQANRAAVETDFAAAFDAGLIAWDANDMIVPTR